MNKDVRLNAKRFSRRKKYYRIAKLLLIVIILILTTIYFVVSFVYNGYFFTITLDKNLYLDNNIVIYDNVNYKVYRGNIQVESLDFYDNISEKWLPDDIESIDGSHNGEDYLAYTFYIENMGDDSVNYYYELTIDDVIKNLDEAVRFRIYENGKSITYAKKSRTTGKAEINTVPFKNNKTVVLKKVSNFEPGQVNKYTVVMWLEGDDLECTNEILGGELKVHLDFKSYRSEV